MPSVDFDRKIPPMIKSIKKSPDISQKNKDLILKYHTKKRDIGSPRKYKYLCTLKVIATNIDFDFEKATIEDIDHFEDWVYEAYPNDSTLRDYISLMKTFLKWANGGTLPDCAKNLKTPQVEKNKFDKDKILTEEDIKTLIDSCDNARDRAIISVIYETGGRVAEAILDTNIEHLEDDPYGKKIYLHGEKTKKSNSGPRKILLVLSVPYLNTWLSTHPNPGDKDAPLFTNVGTRNKGSRVQYQAIRILLRKIAKRAGINKPVNPHAFRHARATFLASRMKEQPLKKMMGWSSSSTQPDIYVHLSGRDLDRETLKVYGIEDEGNPEISILTPKDCPRCGRKIGADEDFCPKCRLPTNIDYEKQVLIEEEERGIKDELNSMKKQMMRIQESWFEAILLSDFIGDDPQKVKQFKDLMAEFD